MVRHRFFDTLPKDTLGDILSFLRCLPHGAKWADHIPVKQLLEFCRVRGELGKFVRTRFSTLRISKTINGESENKKYGWEVRHGPVLWTKDIRVARAFIKASGGKSLTTIIIGPQVCDKKRDGIDVVDDFRQLCTNVTSLSVKENGPSWVSRFVLQLERLELSTNSQRVHLQSADYDYVYPNLFWKIGGKLTNLTLLGHCLPAHEISKVQKFCRRLKHIYIPAETPESTKALSILLSSYGDQLESAYICHMDEIEMKHVFRACNKARFRADVAAPRHLPATLNILRDQVEKITVSGLYLVDPWLLAKSCTFCINLREISLGGCTVKHVTAIMEKPKPLLGNIEVHIMGNSKEVTQVMDIFSKVARHVEKLSFKCQEYGVGTFDKFVESNNSTLSLVYLAGQTSPCGGIGIIKELLESFVLQEIRRCGVLPEFIMQRLRNLGVLYRR